MKSFEGYLDTDEGDLELKFVLVEGGLKILNEDIEAARKMCDDALISINAIRERLAMDAIEDWQ